MEPWYQVQGPTQAEIEKTMQNSDVYICLYKEKNSPQENSDLRVSISRIIEDESFKRNNLLNTNTNIHDFKKITYESIRENPEWKQKSIKILRQEVENHKPYGSWRGFSTFVMTPLREQILIRIIREVWAPYILQTKFAPIWLARNYSPYHNARGYKRTEKHYERLLM